MYCVVLDKVCLGRCKGGLRVQTMKEFDFSLVSKWCWRTKIDQGELWYKVLSHEFRVKTGLVQ